MHPCPVISDTARHYANMDRSDDYEAEIQRRANAVIDSGDLDAMTGLMSPLEANRFYKSLAVICQCNTHQSREMATLEVRGLLTAASRRVAIQQYKEEMDAAAEAQAVERYIRRMERCA